MWKDRSWALLIMFRKELWLCTVLACTVTSSVMFTLFRASANNITFCRESEYMPMSLPALEPGILNLRYRSIDETVYKFHLVAPVNVCVCVWMTWTRIGPVCYVTSPSSRSFVFGLQLLSLTTRKKHLSAHCTYSYRFVLLCRKLGTKIAHALLLW